jgi:class 3 adenylate cyclase
MGQTATIVITDLVGSTALRADLGEEAADRLRSEHDAGLIAVAGSHGGTVIKGTGDGLILAFAGATEALHASVALQQAIASLGRRSQLPLTARIGISAGDVTFEGGDCFGSPVIEAARLCAAADSNQILVADLVRLLARGRGGLEFAGSTEMVLKGLPDPLVVHSLEWEPAEHGRFDAAGTSPYVGRDREMGLLADALDRARSGSGALALIAGEPGIGKTRLVDEFCRGAMREHGAVVLVGGCHDGDVLANAPFVEALAGWARGEDPAEMRELLGPEGPVLARLAPALRSILPDLGEPLPVPPEAETARLHDSLSQFVLRIAAEHPVVLVLDDLHWADVSTVAILRALARATRSAAVLVIGTYRDTDLDRRHPFAEALGILHREVDPIRIRLGGLASEAVHQFLAELADHDVTAAFADRLADETEGNPFFLRETLLHLVEEGRLRHDGETWVIDGAAGELGVPAGIREVIGRRLSRLSDDANRLLAAGALCEVAMPLPVLAAVTGLEEAAALDAIDEAIAAGIVQPTPVFDEYRFTHALFRHVLTEEMNPSRQVRAHRAIADALEQSIGGAPTATEAATLLRHYQRSAALPGSERGADHAIAVADDAARRFAPHEEYETVGCALELLGDGDPRRLDLLVRRARSSLSDDVDIDEIATAAEAAAHALDAQQGADATCTMLADLVRNAQGATGWAVTWRLARIAEPYLDADRRDLTAAIIRSALLREADHNDPQHPGIMRDTTERRELRSLLLSLPAFDQRFVSMPVASRAEAERLLASTPRRARDDRGYCIVPMSALWCLGRHRQVAEDLEWSLADAVKRGWLLPVVSSSAFISRALCMLGDHDASDEAMARANALLPRVRDTSNATFQTLAGELLRSVVRGTRVPADDLGPLLPFLELPDTSWSGLAVRAGYVRSLGIEGRQEAAITALGPVVEALQVAPGYAENYPLIVAYCIDALWALDCTDGLARLEKNLREKVVEPDVRYPEVDGRWSLALACALTGRVDEAEHWFGEARRVLAEQKTVPLRVAIDLDEAIMWERIGGVDALAKARVLLSRARAGVDHPAMAPWLPRIDEAANRIG